MENKQIIELYWERSENAINETERKYGWYCTYIANHIVQDAGESEKCVKESLQMIWETIPPHRPQNLKAYLYKVTRNHALQMKYPAANPEFDLFSAELVIYAFLKKVESEQRKLFVARYWYLSSVSEIAMQYRMSEGKVEKTVQSLRQKLDGMLAEKNIHLQSEEDLLLAMTEIDDNYLEEAEPVHIQQEKIVNVSVGLNDNTTSNVKAWIAKICNKKSVLAITCVVLLLVVALVWPKNPVEDTPITTLPTEDNEGSGNNDVESEWDGVLISILNGDYFTEAGFETYMSSFPWNKEWEVAALPVYKNLAFVDIAGYQNSSNTVFLSADTLVVMLEDIATKLNMQVVHIKVIKETYSDELKNVATGIEATTDLGSIEITGDGRVYVNFFEGVQLPEEYAMSDSASVEDANKTVNYLLEQYADLFSSEKISPACYEIYDSNGQRCIRYRAVERVAGVAGIEEYYFNKVEFEYNEQLGLTGMWYGDVRDASELVGYYPIISVEEAKSLLEEGKYIEYDMGFSPYDVKISDLRNASYVELMYYTPMQNLHYYYSTYNKYYQPYYCFYVKLGDLEEYCKFYVPAIEGATETEIPVQDEVSILDVHEYEARDGFYVKDDKYYTLEHGDLVETEPPVVDPTEDPYMEYGEVLGEIMEDGSTQWNFYYKGELLVNLEELTMGLSSINPTSYEARYVDGNIVIIAMESRAADNRVATVLMYFPEDGTLRRLTDWISMRSASVPYGLVLTTGLYATMGNEENEVQILDLTTGESVNTGIRYEDIEYIADASDEHFAIVYKYGKIAVVEKATGEIIKKSTYKFNFTPTYITYKDGILYVKHSDNVKVIFVLKDFE